jgi:DNA-binding transcriptional LysR family regulator
MSTAQLSDLDLRLLRVLDALLDTNSVTRAATLLRVTPSAVSHSLRQLRLAMRDPLFVRSGSALRPSPLALAVRPTLRSALVELRHVLDADPEFDPTASRRLFSIVMPDYLIPGVLVPVTNQLRREAPHARVRLWLLGQDTHFALASGELDLVLTAGHSERFLSLDAEMMRIRIHSQRFVCIVRQGHPVLTSGGWGAQAYAELPQIFVSLSGAARNVLDDAIEASGHVRRVALTLAGDASVPAIVAGTDLLATVPEDLAQISAAHHQIAILDLPFEMPPIETFLWWHARFHHDPAHIWWRNRIVSAARKDGAPA